MVNLIRIPSSAYCSLHSGLILPASWAISEADCKVCYAALRAAALEKSATTTLSVAFNLVCSLISGNSARTRNPDLPITTSKPVHPLDIKLRSKQTSPEFLNEQSKFRNSILSALHYPEGKRFVFTSLYIITFSMCVNTVYSIF